ncbi:MAG: hypothetical protein ACJAYA_001121, partial [Bacteroidia bacterium]
MYDHRPVAVHKAMHALLPSLQIQTKYGGQKHFAVFHFYTFRSN